VIVLKLPICANRHRENCRGERTLRRSGETVIAPWWGGPFPPSPDSGFFPCRHIPESGDGGLI